MDLASRGVANPAPTPTPGFRYGVVFGLILTVVVVLIVAPADDWTYAAVFALEGAALVVVVATSRERASVRRLGSALTAAAAGAWVLAVALGAIPAVVLQ